MGGRQRKTVGTVVKHKRGEVRESELLTPGDPCSQEGPKSSGRKKGWEGRREKS